MGLPRRRQSVRRLVALVYRDRGQALAEFALVAPIMALILVSIVQFAFIFERQIGIENAVRDAARRGATFTTNASNWGTNGADILNDLETIQLPNNVEAFSMGNVSSDSVCYTDITDSSGLGSVLIKVSVTYRHPLFLPIITQIIDGIDGANDNALAVSTYSQFTVQNDATTSSTVGGNTPPKCVT